MIAPPPPTVTDPRDVALWRAMEQTVDAFDQHLERALRVMADRLTVDLEELPTPALVDVALRLLAVADKPAGRAGPVPYLTVPEVVLSLVDAGVPLVALERPGPAGYRCAGVSLAAQQTGRDDPTLDEHDETAGLELAGRWGPRIGGDAHYACLIPVGHLGPHGYARNRIVAELAAGAGYAPEYDRVDAELDELADRFLAARR